MSLQLMGLLHQRHKVTQEGGISFIDVVLQAGTAVLVSSQALFNRSTFYLMTGFKTPISEISSLEGGDMLAPGALLLMAERRAKAQNILLLELANGNTCADCRETIDSDTYRAALLKVFDMTGWLPDLHAPGARSVQGFTGRMRKVRDIVCEGVHCHSDELGARVDVLSMAHRVESACQPICLGCMKENGLFKRESCKHQRSSAS